MFVTNLTQINGFRPKFCNQIIQSSLDFTIVNPEPKCSDFSCYHTAPSIQKISEQENVKDHLQDNKLGIYKKKEGFKRKNTTSYLCEISSVVYRHHMERPCGLQPNSPNKLHESDHCIFVRFLGGMP